MTAPLWVALITTGLGRTVFGATCSVKQVLLLVGQGEMLVVKARTPPTKPVSHAQPAGSAVVVVAPIQGAPIHSRSLICAAGR